MRKVYLPVAGAIFATDRVLAVKGSGPVMTGEGDTNLACGSCKSVVAKGCAADDIIAYFPSTGRLLLECQCGASCVAKEAEAAH